MSKAILIVSLLIFLVACDDSNIVENKGSLSASTQFYSDQQIPYNDMKNATFYQSLFDSEQRMLVSYIKNETDSEFRCLDIDLMHRDAPNHYIDFGYLASFNGVLLNRKHKQLNFNQFTYFIERNNFNPWPFAETNRNYRFKSDEGKMIHDVDVTIQNPKMIAFAITKDDEIRVEEGMTLPLNRSVNPSRTLIGFEIYDEANDQLHAINYLVKQSTNSVKFSSNDINRIKSLLQGLGTYKSKIWVLEMRILDESIRTQLKQEGSEHTTPIVLKSVHSLNVNLTY